MRSSAIRSLAILFTLAIVLAAVARAQAAAAKDDAPTKKAGDSKDKTPAQPVDRLPNFYAPVVNPEQRIEIYTIQDDYRDRIADLKSQLEAMTAERDAKIAAVLTPAQRKQVREAEADSKTKSQGRGSDDEAPSAASGSSKGASTKSATKEPEKATPAKSSPSKTPAAKAPAAKSATGKAATGK